MDFTTAELLGSIGLSVLAYLLGSIPVSIIVGKVAKGVDIRDHGSGNPGTTNAIRVLGRKLGFIVFFGDVLKGAVIVVIVRVLVATGVFDPLLHPLFYGVLAALGHSFSLFLGFKGGKAVATSAGAFLAYVPVLGLFGLFGYVLALRVTHYVSVASCTGATFMLIAVLSAFFAGPVQDSAAAYVLGSRHDYWMLVLSFLVFAFIIYRHRENFKRLKAGTEPKSTFFQKKDASGK